MLDLAGKDFKAADKYVQRIKGSTVYELRENIMTKIQKRASLREFPDGPVVRTPCFHCKEHGFDPWSGN